MQEKGLSSSTVRIQINYGSFHKSLVVVNMRMVEEALYWQAKSPSLSSFTGAANAHWGQRQGKEFLPSFLLPPFSSLVSLSIRHERSSSNTGNLDFVRTHTFFHCLLGSCTWKCLIYHIYYS